MIWKNVAYYNKGTSSSMLVHKMVKEEAIAKLSSSFDDVFDVGKFLGSLSRIIQSVGSVLISYIIIIQFRVH